METRNRPFEARAAIARPQRGSLLNDVFTKEAVLARSMGTTEDIISVKQTMHERLRLRLRPDQEAEKQTLEERIHEMESTLQSTTDASTRRNLIKEIEEEKHQLELLMKKFKSEMLDRVHHACDRLNDRINRRSADFLNRNWNEDGEWDCSGQQYRLGRYSSGPLESTTYDNEMQDAYHHQPGDGGYEEMHPRCPR